MNKDEKNDLSEEQLLDLLESIQISDDAKTKARQKLRKYNREDLEKEAFPEVYQYLGKEKTNKFPFVSTAISIMSLIVAVSVFMYNVQKDTLDAKRKMQEDILIIKEKIIRYDEVFTNINQSSEEIKKELKERNIDINSIRIKLSEIETKIRDKR